MSVALAGEKYALALFQIAREKNELERIENELRTIKEIMDSNGDILAFLQSPNIPKEQKKEILKQAFSECSIYIQNTLFLMVDRNRIPSIPLMIDSFIELSYEFKGRARAIVESVRPLTEEEKLAISDVFSEKVKKTALEIENIINTDLLGGIKIQIGNRIFDGSLQGRLESLKRQLVGYQS